MLTAFMVEAEPERSGLGRLINKLRRDRIIVEQRCARGVCLRCVTYKSYNRKVRLDRLDAVIGNQRGRLLCNEKLNFPSACGYMRFYSTAFEARLCTNMAYEVIKGLDNAKQLKIGIYDPNATASDFLIYALSFCADVKVVTNEDGAYATQLSIALDELGASAVVTSKVDELADRDFIIAPNLIDEKLPIKESAILLTVAKPKIEQAGLVYYKYHIKMPNGFANIKPDEFDEVYFCSALYTLENQYELGSIVPVLCYNNSCSQTTSSLTAYLARNLTAKG